MPAHWKWIVSVPCKYGPFKIQKIFIDYTDKMLSFHVVTLAVTLFKNDACHWNSCNLKLQTYTLKISLDFFLLPIHYFIRISSSETNSLNNFGKQMGKSMQYSILLFLNMKKYLRDVFLKQIELYYAVKYSYFKKYKIAIVQYSLAPFSFHLTRYFSAYKENSVHVGIIDSADSTEIWLTWVTRELTYQSRCLPSLLYLGYNFYRRHESS